MIKNQNVVFRRSFALLLALGCSAGIYFGYEWYWNTPKFHIDSISVNGRFLDVMSSDKEKDDFDSANPLRSSLHEFTAFQKVYGPGIEAFLEGKRFRLISLNNKDKKIEEKYFDFPLHSDVGDPICGGDVICVNIEGSFAVNMKYTPDIQKIQLYEGDKFLAETKVGAFDEDPLYIKK